MEARVRRAAAAGGPRSRAELSPDLEHRLRATDVFASEVAGHPNGTLLRGRIVERERIPEEKLVDVLCALRVLRCAIDIASGRSAAQAVIVLSEDVDLTPSYEMAEQLGVPVYAAANETVHTRPGSWLLLGDSVMTDLCGRAQGSTQGVLRKAALVDQLSSHPQARRWTARYLDRATGRLVLRHRTGVEGTWAGRMTPRPIELHPAGVDLGRRRQDFPRLKLSEEPVDLPPELTEAEIIQWPQPTRAEVVLEGGAVRTLEAAPGTATAGMRVLVDVPRHGRPRLVGAVDRQPVLDGWDDPTRPRLVEVLDGAASPGALTTAVLSGTGELTLVPPSDVQARRGDRFAAVPVRHEAGKVSHVIAVSSVLPARR